MARIVMTLGIPPNVLTLSSLVPMALAAWNLGHGRFATAGLWIVAGGALDLIDGAVARASGKTSDFGAVLDSVVDRASDTLVYVGAAYYFHTLGASVHVTVTTVALGGALGVSYARARAENVIDECRVGFTERGERLVLIILGLFFAKLGTAILLLAFLSWLTTVQRLLHVHRVISEQRTDKNLDVWGPIGRWIFLNWPRGSWQYDLICAAIILLLLFLPPLPTP